MIRTRCFRCHRRLPRGSASRPVQSPNWRGGPHTLRVHIHLWDHVRCSQAKPPAGQQGKGVARGGERPQSNSPCLKLASFPLQPKPEDRQDGGRQCRSIEGVPCIERFPSNRGWEIQERGFRPTEAGPRGRRIHRRLPGNHLAQEIAGRGRDRGSARAATKAAGWHGDGGGRSHPHAHLKQPSLARTQLLAGGNPRPASHSWAPVASPSVTTGNREWKEASFSVLSDGGLGAG
ncbi:UNVERIFIED_CONTAM: hypothetical protein K2H54_031614 [Gekko kuhli]